MRKLRREASAEGDTLQRIVFHALAALDARSDGSAVAKWRQPLQAPLEEVMKMIGHASQYGAPLLIEFTYIAAVHEIARALIHASPPSDLLPKPPQQHDDQHSHQHQQHQQQQQQQQRHQEQRPQLQRRRFHIISLGFHAAPHWVNLFMRLAAHFSSSPTPSHPHHPIPSPDSTTPPIHHTPPSPPLMPHVRITGVDFGTLRFKEAPSGTVPVVGEYLGQVASRLGLPFSFHGVQTTPEEFSPGMVRVEQGEEVVVMATMSLMLFPDDSVLRSNPRHALLKWIKSLNPVTVLHVGLDVDTNGPFFLARVREKITKFSAFLESLDCSMPHSAPTRAACEEFFARDLMNSIACEGTNRWFRSERLSQWQERMERMGFESVPVGTETLVAVRQITEGRDKRFKVELDSRSGAAVLSWHGLPIIFVAGWR
ncbi:hypothetical protein CLOM_g12274 [Closterium sp. NIES-68]|nr:hypothetical protein CLOM_g12274 [Closterium sp. NIES-68]GJP86543.1 hypothetical protein CLOP_g16554 [Closterium sp. NIES-67]